ncbi:MAG: JAB domain-containing protein [Lachnospiraceae bacterium]|nr:JAB domain-containing protein [Lachnospiraceae bacterium]
MKNEEENALEEGKNVLKNVRIRLIVSEADNLYSKENMGSPKEAIAVMSELLSTLDREYVCVVNLDVKSRPINYNLVSVGDISSAYVPIQNVFKSAILSNSCRVMLFHSHPSGDCSPSTEDYVMTERVIQAGKLLNVPVVDHIIIAGGSGNYYSFRENNYGLFEDPINKNVIEDIIKDREKTEKKPKNKSNKQKVSTDTEKKTKKARIK